MQHVVGAIAAEDDALAKEALLDPGVDRIQPPATKAGFREARGVLAQIARAVAGAGERFGKRDLLIASEVPAKKSVDGSIDNKFLSMVTRRGDLPYREVRAALRTGHGIMDDIIASHRAAGGGDDLLGLLMAARDEETGAGLSDAELHDELMTFLNAGHETTAVLLSWALHALAGEPERTGRVRFRGLSRLPARLRR